jgi:predicted glycosyltransferase
MTPRRIWIDLDNSPHVPFFVPIIKSLRQRGCEVILTSRDNAQVNELVTLHGLESTQVGHHFGKNRLAKVFGTIARSLRLSVMMARRKADLAVSHGSRSQTIASFFIGVPSVVIFDYEHASKIGVIQPTWVMAPEVIPQSRAFGPLERSLRYPGIKEDVYISSFQPDRSVRRALRLSDDDLVVTVRPPASEAHYHNPLADTLLREVVAHVVEKAGTRIILLPRTANQNGALRDEWKDLISAGRVIVPEHALDGLNLIWNSDLVVSGGGTMNREAAALGVPVYSIFRGTIGAVDKYLVGAGRLTLIENVPQVREKIKLVRRPNSEAPADARRPALDVILTNLFTILESPASLPQH